MASKLILVTLIMLSALPSFTQKQDIAIIAYYTGGKDADSFAVQKLTHIIFSFCHLKENKLSVIIPTLFP